MGPQRRSGAAPLPQPALAPVAAAAGRTGSRQRRQQQQRPPPERAARQPEPGPGPGPRPEPGQRGAVAGEGLVRRCTEWLREVESAAGRDRLRALPHLRAL